VAKERKEHGENGMHWDVPVNDLTGRIKINFGFEANRRIGPAICIRPSSVLKSDADAVSQ
jgi:hypothetical protein